MPKCPKCETRKGKRFCPALATEICSLCCAENRLKTISCPSDCPYLGSEHYQHKRRQEKAVSRGKAMLQALAKLFSNQVAHDFALDLQADIYFYCRENGAVDNATAARALESLKNSCSKILIPEGVPHPLAQFLIERLTDGKRYPVSPKFTSEDRVRAMGTLIPFVRSLGADGSRNYHELISSFFDALDFEADLDYSPYDASGPGSEKERRTESGLILPS